MSLKALLEEAGFTDITENPNGTWNATKDGNRYEGLYLENIQERVEDNDAVIITPCTMKGISKHENKLIDLLTSKEGKTKLSELIMKK